MRVWNVVEMRAKIFGSEIVLRIAGQGNDTAIAQTVVRAANGNETSYSQTLNVKDGIMLFSHSVESDEITIIDGLEGASVKVPTRLEKYVTRGF